MTTLDELAEHIMGVSEGGFRRRLVTGLIFTFVLFVLGRLLFGWQLEGASRALGGVPLADVLKSTQFLVLTTLFVFAVGAIFEAMADGFVIRGVSMTFGVLTRLLDLFDPMAERAGPGTGSTKNGRLLWVAAWKTIVIAATLPLWPIAIIACTVLSSIGVKRLYRVGFAESNKHWLSSSGASFLDHGLPSEVREGLDILFGDRFEAAWQVMIGKLSPVDRSWALKLTMRNRDLASFLSAGFFAVALCLGIGLNRSVDWRKWWMSYGLCCLICYLLFGTVALVRRTVVEVLELQAIHGLQERSTESRGD